MFRKASGFVAYFLLFFWMAKLWLYKNLMVRCSDDHPAPDTNISVTSYLSVSVSVTHTGAVCVRDRLTLRFCHTLRWLGRCLLPNVRAQCCKTCSQRSRSTSRHWGAATPKPHPQDCNTDWFNVSMNSTIWALFWFCHHYRLIMN